MNIIAFSNNTGSVQWRLKGPANYINAYTPHSMYVANSVEDWDESLWMPETELVVAQMWRNHRAIDFIHSQNCPVVYEADDIILNVGGGTRKKLMDLTPEQEEQTIKTYKMVDLITVTTEKLADHYRQFNDNVIVLPNYLDYVWWGEPYDIKHNGPIRVGWMGSTSHHEDLLFIAPIIETILEEFLNVRFVFCGHGGVAHLYGDDVFKNLPKDRIEYVTGVPLEYWPHKSKSLNLDIGIAPLLDDEFNTGKSPIKYFEYSANGVPGVYSDTVVYKDTVKHLHTGLLAKTEDDWVKHLRKLIKDENLRNRIARNAQEDVKNNFNLKDHYGKWVLAYQSVINNYDRSSSSTSIKG